MQKRVLFSLMLGKQYTQVELPGENRFSVSGKNLGDLKEMADRGKINEAENLLLENLDYENKEEVAAAVLFYEYVGQMEESFLKELINEDEEYTVRLSPVKVDEQGNIVECRKPLDGYMDRVIKKRIRMRYVIIRVHLFGRDREILLGLRLEGD